MGRRVDCRFCELIGWFWLVVNHDDVMLELLKQPEVFLSRAVNSFFACEIYRGAPSVREFSNNGFNHESRFNHLSELEAES